jgi:hypothetical protein
MAITTDVIEATVAEESKKEPEAPAAKNTSPQAAWNAMSSGQKGAMAIRILVQIVAISWTLNDIRHRPAEKIKGNKKLWMFLAFSSFGNRQVLVPVGPIAYILFGRKR